MLGLRDSEVHNSGDGWSPVYVSPDGEYDEDQNDDMEVEQAEPPALLPSFLLASLPNNDSAVIWRGPRKNALIKQFLTDVDWGELDT